MAKKREAEEAVDLLRDHVARRKEIELASNGLIILEATYGVLDSDDSTRFIDVTSRLYPCFLRPLSNDHVSMFNKYRSRVS